MVLYFVYQLLKTLTSNWRNPYLVWDNSTRAELKDVLRNCRVDPENEGPLVQPFVYSAHEGLVSVGGVYIDIYNEQPEFPIEVSRLIFLNVRTSVVCGVRLCPNFSPYTSQRQRSF